MNDDLKVGRIVFGNQGGEVFSQEGGCSPNPLEYAPKGTLEELATLRTENVELKGLVRKIVSKLNCSCPTVHATIDGITLAGVKVECATCEIKGWNEVRAIMEEKI